MRTPLLWLATLALGLALCSQISERAPDEQAADITGWLKQTGKYIEEGEYDSSFALAQRVIIAAEKTANWEAWGNAQIHYLGSCYYLNQSAEAAATFPQLEQLGRAHIHPDSTFWGGYFNVAGAIFDQLGNYEEAIRYGLKEIAFYEKSGDRAAQAIASNNIGAYYLRRGDYDRALEYTQSALQLYRSNPKTDPADLAWTYGNLGAIWYRKKDYPRAIANAHEALSMLEKHFPEELPHDYIVAYNDLANVYVENGEPEKALEYLQKALAVHKKNGIEREIENVWHNLGYAYRMMGRYPEATAYLKKAIERYRPNHPNLGKAYRHLGIIAQRQGNLRGALAYHQQALRSLTDSFPHQDILANPAPQRVNAYFDFLFTLRDKGETLRELATAESNPVFLEAALSTYDLAAGVLDSMRAEYQEGSRQFWNEEAQPIIENAIAVAMQLHRNTGDLRYLEKAFEYAEKNKALLLAEALRDAAARQQAGIPDSVLEQEKSLKIDIAFYKRQIFREQQRPQPDTTKILLWQKNILERRRANEALLTQLEQSYPEYYRIKYNAPPLTISALQQRLPPNTSLLQFFKGDRELFVFYFDQHTAKGLSLPTDSNFVHAFERLLRQLRDRDQAAEQGRSTAAMAQFAADAHSLYRVLLAPVVAQIPEKLVVVPDGNLAYLPFELLVSKEPSAPTNYAELPFLLRQTVLRYEYSASLALTQPTSSRASQLFAGYAPAYDEDSVVATSSRGDQRNCRDADAATFAALHSNQAEVSQIARLFGGQSYLGKTATEANFKQRAHESRVLHFAMHGFLNDCDPMYSGLAFSRPQGRKGEGARVVGEDTNNGSSSDEANDGFLHAYEIYNLKLNAELAVLSACNTGQGQLAKGEGVISLARAFKYAGCPNVLMSLWQADDEATAHIMQDFYRHLKKGMGKAEAIRQAKLDYLSANTRNHPFFWGAFVLIGDDAPISRPSSFGLWYALALALAGVGVLLWFWRTRSRTR